jgi:16S rRNA (cytosine967-C5)-methyltransferase
MVQPKTQTARAVAAEVLNQFDPRRNYAGPILDKLLSQTGERQRATDLVFGSIRNRKAIDIVIEKFSDRPIRRISTELLNIIRVATYELIYSYETPIYSIINEAVENSKVTRRDASQRVGGRKQAGFVNAVLHQITKHITNRQSELKETNLRKTLPQTPASGCEFDVDFLPDLKAQPVDYLSTCFSLPRWLISEWLEEFGIDTARQICLASNRKPSIYIRPNKLKTKTEEIAEKFHQADIDFEIVPLDAPWASSISWLSHEYRESRMIKIKSPKAVSDLPGFEEGLFTIQDISAAQPVQILNPQPDWKILDLCAAPGTKTTQLAEYTGDKAAIIATDIDSQRLQKLKENITRLGIKSIKTVLYEQLMAKPQDAVISENGPFDAVLLDVPCSNTGVLARRVEARFRINQKAMDNLVKTQLELLKKAAIFIKHNGKICYSTCSIQRCENGILIRDFLSQNPSFGLESEKSFLPAADKFDHDGGYVAVIVLK